MRTSIILVFVTVLRLSAQDPVQSEKWNLNFQATSIGQYHGSFNSPYADVFSLQGHPEAEASLTSTLYFGWQLARDTQFYFDPELAGGRGLAAPTESPTSPMARCRA